jgi:hypothetical protein
MAQLKLWKFSENYGRMGDVEGLFIATEEEVDKFLDKRNVCFGEVLGKHSEVNVYFEKGKNLECLNVSASTVLELLNALDRRCISGLYPFQYVSQQVKCNICDKEGDFYDDWMFDADTIECPDCGCESYTLVEE